MIGSVVSVHFRTSAELGVHDNGDLATMRGRKRPEEDTEGFVEVSKQHAMPIVAIGVTTLILVGVEPTVLAVNDAGSDVGIHQICGHHHLAFDV